MHVQLLQLAQLAQLVRQLAQLIVAHHQTLQLLAPARFSDYDKTTQTQPSQFRWQAN